MSRGVTLVVTVALAGCNPAGFTPSLEPVTRTTALNDGLVSDGIIIGNALSTQSLMFNALTTHAEANKALTVHPLADETYALVPVLRDALKDPAAREVFGYLVGCALGAEEAVHWSDPDRPGSPGFEFKGAAGLCRSWAKINQGTPVGAECEQLVSACLLARNNRDGFHVPLSVRGNDSFDSRLAAGDEILAFGWRDRSSSVRSLDPCHSPQAGAYRECGFQAGEVRRCTPGQEVSVAAGAPPEGRCEEAPLGGVDGKMVLRVCEGVSACDPRSLAVLGASEGRECPSYPHRPTVSFSCPASGTFNVMSGPYDSDTEGKVDLGEEHGGLAKEEEAYAVREGAFFGTLFDPGALSYQVEFQQGEQLIWPPPGAATKPVYRRMFACNDSRYLDPEAYAHGRSCSRGDCAAESLGRCQDVCAGSDDRADGEFRDCSSETERWELPLTTFLHRPCDLVPDKEAKRCLWK